MVQISWLVLSQLWLGVIAAFELPILIGLGVRGLNASSVEHMVREMHKKSNKDGRCSESFTRLYLLFVTMLTLCRVILIVDMHNTSLWLLVALFHILEAAFFCTEAVKGGFASKYPVLIVIVLNGIWFGCTSLSLVLNSKGSA
jgi:hypothetical protein